MGKEGRGGEGAITPRVREERRGRLHPRYYPYLGTSLCLITVLIGFIIDELEHGLAAAARKIIFDKHGGSFSCNDLANLEVPSPSYRNERLPSQIDRPCSHLIFMAFSCMKIITVIRTYLIY